MDRGAYSQSVLQKLDTTELTEQSHTFCFFMSPPPVILTAFPKQLFDQESLPQALLLGTLIKTGMISKLPQMVQIWNGPYLKNPVPRDEEGVENAPNRRQGPQ